MPSHTSELNQRVLIRAGAGAGKTTELVQVFYQFTKNFIQEQKHTPRIAITTFTRKATQELKERLLQYALQKQANEDPSGELFKLVNSKNKTHISTIHGVLSLFLNQFGTEISLSPDFKLISDDEENFLIKKTIRRLFKEGRVEGSEQQIILDGVKLKQLIHFFKIYYALKFQWQEPRVYSVDEVKTYILEAQAKLKIQCSDLAQEIKRSSVDEGYLRIAQGLLDFSRSENHFILACRDFYENYKKPRYLPKKPQVTLTLEEELKSILKKIEAVAKEEAPEFDLEEQLQACEVSTKLIHFFDLLFKEIISEKKSKSQITMADLELFSLELIKTSPSAVQVFSQSWDYWMIDEYQDTSPLQVQLLDAFIGDRPYFIVGDPQQSIYSFRGARREVFESRKTLILNSKSETLLHSYRLKQINYRSTPNIVNFLNYTFSTLGDQFQAMDIDEKKEIKDECSVRFMLNMDSDETSHAAILSEIYHYLNLNISPEEICILARTNKDLQDLALTLKSSQLPFQLHSGAQFHNTREVMDLCFFIKFLKNSFDDENLIGLLRIPHWSFKAQDLFAVINKRESKSDLSLWAILNQFFKTHPVVEKLNLYRYLSYQVGVSYALKEFILRENFLYSSAALDPSGKREANIWKFISKLSEEEKRPGFNLLQFIQKSNQELSAERAEEHEVMTVIEPKRINLMTIHASKGLQFKAVILINTHKAPRTHSTSVLIDETQQLICFSIFNENYQKQILPPQAEDLKEQLKLRDEEESLRFFYVALSRAQNFISITADHLKKDIPKKSWYQLAKFHLTEGEFEGEGYRAKVELYSNKDYLDKREAYWQRLQAQSESENAQTQFLPEWESSDTINTATSSVTDLLQVHKVTSNTAWVESAKKAVFGTQVHRLFELLKLNRQFVEEHIKKDEYLAKAFSYLNEVDKQLPLFQIIEKGHVEWGYTVRMHEKKIQGQIDLWGVVDNVLYIVDYKTGSSAYSEKAFQQIEIYHQCLCHIWSEFKDLKAEAIAIYPFDREYFVKGLVL